MRRCGAASSPKSRLPPTWRRGRWSSPSGWPSAAPIANAYAKEAILAGMDLPLEQGLRLEADLAVLLHASRDRDEGIRAFLEKRPPKFTGG